MKRSGSLGVWLGKEREKEILRRCTTHVSKIIETVEITKQSVEAYRERDLPRAKEFAKRASDTEKAADEIKKQILDDLGKGIFHPIDRDEILRLVLEVDGIASNAKASVKKLMMIPRDMISDSLADQLLTLANRLVSATQTMGKAFSALVEGSADVFRFCQEVETWEENIDEFRAALIEGHFLPWCQEPGRTGLCIILKESMDNLEKVADMAEDVADVIRSIAILSK